MQNTKNAVKNKDVGVAVIASTIVVIVRNARTNSSDICCSFVSWLLIKYVKL